MENSLKFLTGLGVPVTYIYLVRKSVEPFTVVIVSAALFFTGRSIYFVLEST